MPKTFTFTNFKANMVKLNRYE